ncbi:MAG TPA: 30S ribosomal protein S17 [Candidatus Colwellbacteria bacterium]|nr:30S ribosomal protein S17 [Candidatus Colwellbacteria bacterium]HQA95813.1 30S ribosomal protein S17 [Candidatus Colwellbacteria bacterium]
MEENNIQKISSRRRFAGVVVSDKMKKTVVVEVAHTRKNPKYQKYYTKNSRFKAEAEDGLYKIGDKVVIEETIPLSKEKHWKVVSKKD